MESLSDMTQTLKDIEDLSEKIISKTIDLLKEINDDESEIIEDIVEQIDGTSDEEATEEAQEYLNSLVSDANIVYEGIGEFARAVVRGEAIDKISSTFLQKVWYGDMYDDSHIEGLKRLQSDLQKNLNLLNDDNIISVVTSRLEKKFMNNSVLEE